MRTAPRPLAAFDVVAGRVHCGTTIVLASLPVGTISWDSTPLVSVVDPFAGRPALIRVPSRRTKTADGNGDVPVVPARPAPHRGTTTTRKPGACGSWIVVAPSVRI